ncbi:MAG: helix-turn-helix transcriptional regulator [Acidobacteriota bacterium]
MKKSDKRGDDVRVTKSCGNVFIDLGFEPAEAVVMLMRSDLMLALERYIAAKGWTQAEAAKRMGITQPRVSKIKKRKLDEFSLDMLLLLANRLGIRTELKLAA